MNTPDEPVDFTPYGGSPSAVLVIEIDTPSASGLSNWHEGPLPVIQASNATTQSRVHASATDAAARRTLVAQQQADVLYGGDAESIRRHKHGEGELLALEVLSRAHITLLVAHFASIDPSKLYALIGQSRRLQSREGSLWQLLEHAYGQPLVLAGGARARIIHFFDQGAADDETTLVNAYALVTEMDRGDPRALSARAGRHKLTVQRPDWSALVMRDGAAFVAHQTSTESFAPSLRVFAHTIHLDALLLALLQRDGVDESARQAIEAPLTDAEALHQLEQNHFEFKRKVWRTSLTLKRTAPVDDVLRAFQEELLTERDLLEVEHRVQDGARLAMSTFTRSQEAAQQRLNDMVQISSVVIGSFVFSFTAAPVIAQPSWPLFLIAATVGLAIAVTAFWVVREYNKRERSPASRPANEK